MVLRSQDQLQVRFFYLDPYEPDFDADNINRAAHEKTHAAAPKKPEFKRLSTDDEFKDAEEDAIDESIDEQAPFREDYKQRAKAFAKGSSERADLKAATKLNIRIIREKLGEKMEALEEKRDAQLKKIEDDDHRVIRVGHTDLGEVDVSRGEFDSFADDHGARLGVRPGPGPFGITDEGQRRRARLVHGFERIHFAGAISRQRSTGVSGKFIRCMRRHGSP